MNTTTDKGGIEQVVVAEVLVPCRHTQTDLLAYLLQCNGQPRSQFDAMFQVSSGGPLCKSCGRSIGEHSGGGPMFTTTTTTTTPTPFAQQPGMQQQAGPLPFAEQPVESTPVASVPRDVEVEEEMDWLRRQDASVALVLSVVGGMTLGVPLMISAGAGVVPIWTVAVGLALVLLAVVALVYHVRVFRHQHSIEFLKLQRPVMVRVKDDHGDWMTVPLSALGAPQRASSWGAITVRIANRKEPLMLYKARSRRAKEVEIEMGYASWVAYLNHLRALSNSV